MNKTIEIQTTQNVSIEYELASLWERMLAWILDAVIAIFVYYAFLTLAMTLFRETDSIWGMFFGILSFLTYFVYHIAFEMLRRGRTPGKLALGLKVVRLDGKDPEWSDATLRALLHLVDSIFCLGIVGCLFIKTTSKSQRLGDMAAHTTVIKINSLSTSFKLSDILNIASLETYQPIYPQVQNLSEHDMIFVKNALNRYKKYPNQAHQKTIAHLADKMASLLAIKHPPADKIAFLTTLLQDYIVLTR